MGRFAKKIGRVTAESPTPSIIDRRRHRTEELSATAKWRLSGIVSGAPTGRGGNGWFPVTVSVLRTKVGLSLMPHAARK